MRLLRAARLAALLGFGSCLPPAQERPEPVGHESVDAPIVTPLLGSGIRFYGSFYGEVPLMERYCRGTTLTATPEPTNDTTRSAAELVCGPILGRFEAALVSNLLGASLAREQVRFDGDASTEDLQRLPQPYERGLFGASSRNVSGQTYVEVYWYVSGDARETRLALEIEQSGQGPVPAMAALPRWSTEESTIEKEILVSTPAGLRLVAREPWLDAFESSGGLALATGSGLDGTTFLEVVGDARSAGNKTEKLRAWRFTPDGREVLFEVPFLSWSKNPDAQAELHVTRIRPAPGGIELVGYRILFDWLPGAKDRAGELYPVDLERGYPTSIVELHSVTRVGSTFESLH